MAKGKCKKGKKRLITFISVIIVLTILIAGLNLLSLQNLLKKGNLYNPLEIKNQLVPQKDEKYKLIEYRNGDNEEDKWTFLYDIKNDIWETQNLANREEYQNIINDMRDKMLKHRDDWEEQSHPWGIDFWPRF